MAQTWAFDWLSWIFRCYFWFLVTRTVVYVLEDTFRDVLNGFGSNLTVSRRSGRLCG